VAEEQGGNPAGYVTVEIYDQVYHLSGQDAEHIRAWRRGLTPRCAPWRRRAAPWIRCAWPCWPR